MCGGGPNYPAPLTAEEIAADTDNPYKNPSGYSAPRWKPEEFKKEQDIALAAERNAATARIRAAQLRTDAAETIPRSSSRGGNKTAQQKANIAAGKERAKRRFNTAPSGQKYGAMRSDIRLKENIVQTGISNLGYKIYEFNYKNDDTRYRGAMAQDVITKLPEAIETHDGYLYVDYDMIDINMEVI